MHDKSGRDDYQVVGAWYCMATPLRSAQVVDTIREKD